MNILLLAPQPFFQERGTPIAVRLLAEAYARRGHRVDLLVFPEGQDVEIPGVRILRIPGLRGIGPGFSVKKLVNDVVLAVSALGRVLRQRYDVYHGVEEAVFIAGFLKRIKRAPVVYDMDSSMAEQMADKSGLFRRVAPFLRWCENRALRNADVLVPVCEALADLAKPFRTGPVVLLRDPPVSTPASHEEGAAKRREINFPGRLHVYVGNLEKYQGIDLLLDAFARLVPQAPDARLLIVGGTPADVAKYRAKAATLGLADVVRLDGPRPMAELGAYLAAADVLVSPRLQGRNTPMKVYSYMQSGRAIVATAIPTHTQVLDDSCALLAAPEAEAYAQALARAGDSTTRERIGLAAREKCAREYGMPAYEQSVDALVAAIGRARGA